MEQRLLFYHEFVPLMFSVSYVAALSVKLMIWIVPISFLFLLLWSFDRCKGMKTFSCRFLVSYFLSSLPTKPLRLHCVFFASTTPLPSVWEGTREHSNENIHFHNLTSWALLAQVSDGLNSHLDFSIQVVVTSPSPWRKFEISIILDFSSCQTSA